ncbi:MAG: hypothetical protein AB1657_03120 [Candidatus Micrarchaeota archaeon]
MEEFKGLKRMKAGSLSPELYGEISGFLSSLKPDFALSGRTSLHAIYAILQGTKKKKLPAKQLRKAEEIIRALCAAAEAREIRFGKAGAAPEEKGAGKKNFPVPGQPELRMIVSEEARRKFRSLGITSERDMERVAGAIGEEEFSRRHAKVLEMLPRRAYVPFFSKVPDFLASSDFYPALILLHEKIGVIDRVFGDRKPKGLDYEKDPAALFRNFREIAETAGLDALIGRTISQWSSERPDRAVDPYKKLDFSGLRDPKMLERLFEGLGYYVTPIASGVNACIRRGEGGEAESILLLHGTMAYEIPALCILFWQAGIAPERLRAAGVKG